MAYNKSIKDVLKTLHEDSDHYKVLTKISEYSSHVFLCEKNDYSSPNMVKVKIKLESFEDARQVLSKCYDVDVKDHETFYICIKKTGKNLKFKFESTGKPEGGNGRSNACEKTDKKETQVRDSIINLHTKGNADIRRFLVKGINWATVNEAYTNEVYSRMVASLLKEENLSYDDIIIETQKKSRVDLAKIYKMAYTKVSVADLHVYRKSLHENPPTNAEELVDAFWGISHKDKICLEKTGSGDVLAGKTIDEVVAMIEEYVDKEIKLSRKIHNETMFSLHDHDKCFRNISLFKVYGGGLQRSLLIEIGEFEGKTFKLRLGSNGTSKCIIELVGTATAMGKAKNYLNGKYVFKLDKTKTNEELFNEHYRSRMFDQNTNSLIRNYFNDVDFEITLNMILVLKYIEEHREEFMKLMLAGAVKVRKEFHVFDVHIEKIAA